MLTDDLAVGRYHLAGDLNWGFALLGEVGFEKLLVVAAGNEADFLRIGLFSNDESMLAGQFAHLGLGHATEWEQRAAQLLLGQTKEEIGLVFGLVCWALQQPAIELFIEGNVGVMASGNLVCANLPCHNKKLVK